MTANGDVASCYRYWPDRKIEIPRGAWHLVGHLDYTDNRSKPKAPKLKFVTELDRVDLDPRFEGQSRCVATMLEEEQGIVIRAPGTGKTQIALAFAAQCETTVLVLVHTKDILDQWVEYAGNSLPDTKVGIIQGSTERYGQITIAMVQSLKRFYGDPEWWRQWGAVILDESHHAAAESFETVLNSSPAFYRFGFTATNSRADGMERYHQHLLGPVIHKQKFSAPINTTVKPIYSNFRFRYRGRYDWGRLLRALISDEGRNKQIGTVIDRECSRGNSVLVLSRRIEQLERIAEHVKFPSEILTAPRGRAERKRILTEFREGRVRCVLATQLADEALDVPRCNTVILVHPGKHDGRITQQVGRAIRKFEGKRYATIYDVVDRRVGILAKQWRERKRAYAKMGLPIKRRKMKIGGRG
jgi:superfamily II DNA or RNA helicase